MVKLVNADENGKILNRMMTQKIPILQALDIFIEKEQIKKEKISKIILTGVGKDEIQQNIYDIETIKVDEFKAIAAGGLYLAKQEEALVISIGTGTAFVQAKKCDSVHIGGTGVGGGTLINLCRRIGQVDSFEEINKYISKGNLANIDLTINDITINEIKGLPKDTTSSNFGKLSDYATKEDLVIGIVNMIFETIGMMAVFASQNNKNKNIIVTGTITTIPYIKTVFKKIEKLHNIKFIIPRDAEFATAIGAIQI